MIQHIQIRKLYTFLKFYKITIDKVGTYSIIYSDVNYKIN